ncbi:MAG: FlgD immunoglobulin-like domain containing protein [Minisyncoccia bacterium]
MKRSVWILGISLAIGFCCSAMAGELLVNGDFSNNWTNGWERGSDARAVNPEVFSNGSKVTLHLDGEGHFYIVQTVEVSSLDVRFRASFKPNSIENLYGIGYAGFPYVGLGYMDKEGNYLGDTWFFSNDGFIVDLSGAQELPNNTSTRHYIQVSDDAWTTVEIPVQEELSSHLLGIDPAKIDSISIIIGVSNPRSESEGIVEVDYVSLVGPDPLRVVSLAEANQVVGDSLSVIIGLDTEAGGENALGFSLAFDSAILANPSVTVGRDMVGASINSNQSQVSRGRYGIIVSLPAGQSLSPDTYQIVVVTFAVLPGTEADSTEIRFGDQPISREIVDVNASALSSVEWLPGKVQISRGYEADLAPRDNPDGRYSIADWVQAGRFSARLDLPGENEFQKADCAPRSILGDGRITTADWVQAGRYTARLDPLTPVGGPIGSSPKLAVAKIMAGESIVRAVNSVFSSGDTGLVRIELDAHGSENAIGFSLVYDPAVLRIDNVMASANTRNVMLNVNFSQSAEGRIGIALALSSGETFPVGNREIVTVAFTALNTAATVTRIGFGDEPIYREVVDVFANPITASYSEAVLNRTDIATVLETEIGELKNPALFILTQNYPNPFNSTTRISFTLSEMGNVLLSIYSLNGQVVRTVAGGSFQPGNYTVVWDSRDNIGKSVASGLYFCRLEVIDRKFEETRAMVLAR